MNNIIKTVLQLLMFIFISFATIKSSWALRCLEGIQPSSSFDISRATNTSHITSIGTIRVTSSNQATGTLLWESEQMSTTFTCYDDYKTNQSENAYLYLDDENDTLERLFRNTNLTIGVRYNGREYPIGSTERIDLGKLALNAQSNRSTALNNCSFIKKGLNYCADHQTITVNYSIYIKSKGTGSNLSSLSGRTFQVFQLDGKGGRNANGNFQEKVSNMTVNYVECTPIVSTQDVDLGSYSSLEELNKILRKTTFTINIKTEGKSCAQYPFVGKFTSNQKYNETTLTASEAGMKDIVGIKIYPLNSNTALSLDTNIDLGYSNGTTLTKVLEAGVMLLKKPSSAGIFTSTLNYEVYYK